MLAVASVLDVDSELLPRIATGFCGGMSRTAGVCGAVAGGVMGIGIACGRDSADQSVEPAYAATQRFVREFEGEFGARGCAELTGCDLGTPEGQARFRDEKIIDRCAVFTRRAAEMAARQALL